MNCLHLIICIATLLMFNSCSPNPKRETNNPHSNLHDGTSVHLLTWYGYNGTGNPERTVYFYDGEEIEQGALGFWRVVKRVSVMEPGSVLLIYPYYKTLTNDCGPIRTVPYARYAEFLFDEAQKRQVSIVEIPEPDK